MPKLRSGLSRNDAGTAWVQTVGNWAQRLANDSALSPKLRAEFRDVANSCSAQSLIRATSRQASPICSDSLALWLEDPKLDVLLDHETRGHIPADLGRYLFAAGFGKINERSPSLVEFPDYLQPHHANRQTGAFADRFRVQLAKGPSTTVTSHIAKDGHYFIHPDPTQCRSLTVREAARLQTFPDNYFFCGPRTEQYKQVGNAVPALLARQIAQVVYDLIDGSI